MRLARLVSCALILAPAPAAVAQPTSVQAQSRNLDDLSGLWSAKKRFGPDVRGLLIIERTTQGLHADVAGFRTNVEQKGDGISFSLPGDVGRFTGRFVGKTELRGFWQRPGTAVNFRPNVSPVAFKLIGPGRWAGQVEPLADDFTFYIFADRAADASYEVVFRNPEFDIGNQQGIQRLVRDGDSLRLMGRRGNSPERVIATGRIAPELDGFVLSFPGRGGSYDFARDGDASFVYPRARNAPPYRYVAPPPLQDGWRTSTVAREGIDQPAMERLVQSIIDMKMDEADAPEIHALIIARHGKLVLEEYFHGFSRDKLHNIRSAGKSLTATTIGAAMHAGAPLRLDSRVYATLRGEKSAGAPEPQKRAMTLENLLTMSSGHFCDDTNAKAPGNEDYIGDELQNPDWIGYSLSVPLVTKPGAKSVYCSMQPNLALAMLAAATQENPVSIFDRLVARPMQITRYAWGLDPMDRPYGGGGVEIGARDFIKFGQMMLNGGTWNGHRILDPGFVKAASSAQYHLRNVYYGYYWWVEDYPYKDRTLRIYSARGAGGNLVLVSPDLDLVVATMGGNYSNRRGASYLGNLIATSILPAVREKGDDPDAPIKNVDWASPYGASTDGSRVRH